MLMRCLRMLLRSICVFLAFGMIAFAMMFCGGSMRLCRVFILFGGLVVFVSRHFCLVGWVLLLSIDQISSQRNRSIANLNSPT